MVPQHLLPTACYVCGGEPHQDDADHNYWSNRDAEIEFAAGVGDTLIDRPEGYYHAALEVL